VDGAALGAEGADDAEGGLAGGCVRGARPRHEHPQHDLHDSTNRTGRFREALRAPSCTEMLDFTIVSGINTPLKHRPADLQVGFRDLKLMHRWFLAGPLTVEGIMSR